jgi:hypothetical protein
MAKSKAKTEKCPCCKKSMKKGGLFLHMLGAHPKKLKKYFPGYLKKSNGKSEKKSINNVSFVHMKFCCHCGEALPNAIAR